MGSIAEEEPMHPLPPYPYDTNRPNQTNPGTMFINSNPGTMFVNSEKWINQFFLAWTGTQDTRHSKLINRVYFTYIGY